MVRSELKSRKVLLIICLLAALLGAIGWHVGKTYERTADASLYVGSQEYATATSWDQYLHASIAELREAVNDYERPPEGLEQQHLRVAVDLCSRCRTAFTFLERHEVRYGKISAHTYRETVKQLFDEAESKLKWIDTSHVAVDKLQRVYNSVSAKKDILNMGDQVPEPIIDM